MDDEKLKNQIGSNIAAYRKRAGLTQAGLAEKLNYSDKAVSKWERGDSVPDVLTLVQLADQFGITVNDLLTDPNELPADSDSRLEKAMTQVSEKALKRKANKNIILALSSTLVWFVALFAFVILSSFDFLGKLDRIIFSESDIYVFKQNAVKVSRSVNVDRCSLCCGYERFAVLLQFLLIDGDFNGISPETVYCIHKYNIPRNGL